jgi:hypothetical protein
MVGVIALQACIQKNLVQANLPTVKFCHFSQSVHAISAAWVTKLRVVRRFRRIGWEGH